MGWYSDLCHEYNKTYSTARNYEATVAQAASDFAESVRQFGQIDKTLHVDSLVPEGQQWTNLHDPKIAMDEDGFGRFLLVATIDVRDQYEKEPHPIPLRVLVAMKAEGTTWVVRIGNAAALVLRTHAKELCEAVFAELAQQIRGAALHRQ